MGVVHAVQKQSPVTPPRRHDADEPATGLRQSTESRLRRALPLPALIVVELIVIALTVVLVALTPLPWWSGLVLGVVAALPLLVRRSGVSLGHRLWQRTAFAFGRKRDAILIEAPFDVPMSDVNTCGMRWDGDRIVTALRIDPSPVALTRFTPGTTITDDVLPVEAIASCLRQFDLTVESLDIISHGSRAHGDGPIARIYDGILGPLPAAAFRTVWIVLRINPLASTDAIARRGGGATGALKAAMIATRRVANHLTSQGHPATILSAAEITSATWQLTGGQDPETVTEEWDHASAGALRMTSVALDAQTLNTRGLMSVWTPRTISTTLTLHLRNASEDEIGVSAVARFTTVGEDTPEPLPGSRPFLGQERAAVLATLPAADPFPDRGAFEYFATPDFLSTLTVPASGCGQLVGADPQNRAVALPLAGPSVRHVDIAGSLHLAQQVILRAIALGARVLVNTDRPAQWAPMATAVASPYILAIAGAAAGSQVAGQRQEYSVTVFDGVPLATSAQGTLLTISAPARPPIPGADISLLQDADVGPIVKVLLDDASTEVMMVATNDEMRYVGASLSAPDRVYR